MTAVNSWTLTRSGSQGGKICREGDLKAELETSAAEVIKGCRNDF